MSCFDNEYKLNREDEDFPEGEITMASIYSDGPEDEFEDDSFFFEEEDFEEEEEDGPFYDPQDGNYL